MISSNSKIIVGTRASALAVCQTELFLKKWQEKFPELRYELKKIETTGDKIQDRFLAKVGGKGLFLKEIEEALLDRRVHIAVHSLKDVPTELPAELTLACYPHRESPWDVLVSLSGERLEDLKNQAIVGTSSLRRRSQLLKIRPDLNIQLLRGNIQTRIRKLQEKKYDAIVLAEAGISRMKLHQLKYQRLELVPAPGQGALAIEIQKNQDDLVKALRVVHCDITQKQVEMERAVMRALGGNCSVPLGVHAQFLNHQWILEAYLGSPDGQLALHYQVRGIESEAQSLVQKIVDLLLENGGQAILKKSENWVEEVES